MNGNYLVLMIFLSMLGCIGLATVAEKVIDMIAEKYKGTK